MYQCSTHPFRVMHLYGLETTTFFVGGDFGGADPLADLSVTQQRQVQLLCYKTHHGEVGQQRVFALYNHTFGSHAAQAGKRASDTTVES